MEPIKFNFTAKGGAKRPAAQQVKKEEDDKDYVTGFSGNQLVSVAPKQTKDGPYVIPLAVQGLTKRSKSNTGNPSDAPTTPPPPTVPTVIAVDDTPKTLDQLAAEAIIKDATMVPDTEATARSVPLTVQNQIDGIAGITDEEERFKFDLNSRPDEADEEAYEDMPIDEFGFAMLRGMGWAPGGQIGLNNRGLAEPIEFVKRPGYRLGLGATPKDLPVKTKKYIKPGESREPAPIMVAQAGPDGKVRHVKAISEKLVPLKKGLQPGALVAIVSGPHEGLYARVVSAGDDDDIVVRISASSEDVVVSKADVSIVDSATLAQGHPALKFLAKEKKEREKERARDEANEKESEAYHKKESKSSTSSSSSSSGSSWIRPRIMVRIVSKSFNNGKYYNKKVRIYDVVGHNECTVQLDNGSLVEGVKQRMLETVIPPAGGKIMVVEGESKGKVGKLLERSKTGNTERAIVQMIGDLSIESFSLDDVAQYVGTFDEETVDINVYDKPK